MEKELVDASYLTKNDYILIMQEGELRKLDISILSDLKQKEVEFKKGRTHIQWRYKGNGVWNDIISIDELKGESESPKEVQLRQIEGILSWRQGEGLWKELIDINSLSNANPISTMSVNGEGKTILELDSTDHVSSNDYFIIEQEDGTKKVEISLFEDRFNDSAKDIEYETEADINIKSVKDALDKLLYVPLTINLYSNIPNILEKGFSTNSVVFNWSYNKNILSQSFNGENIGSDIRSYNYNSLLNNNKTFTLNTNDDRNIFTKSISFNFLNGRYYGVSNKTDYSNDLIQSLSKELSSSRAKTFTVNCGVGQYIYYCIPSSFGVPTFTVGGFSGGFNKVATIQYTNMYAYTESYDIYSSTNDNLGNTTVVVS